ncbi:7TM chemoreceptor [Cooperia oncophora]
MVHSRSPQRHKEAKKIIPGGGGLFYFSQGPCKIYGPLVCFILYSFMLHCYSHTFWSLLFSFAYRYYVLGNPTPKTRTVVLLLILVYMPSFFQFITFSFASDDVDEVKTAMAKIFDYDMSSECVSGHVSIFKWRTLYTNLYMTLPIIPMYIAILILRRLTIAKLHVDTALSDKTKHLHGQLLKALTLQACLPIFFVLAAATYAIGQLDIYHHPALQYSTFILLDGLPMLSPAISIYFIRPYHVWEKRFCSRVCLFYNNSSASRDASLDLKF